MSRLIRLTSVVIAAAVTPALVGCVPNTSEPSGGTVDVGVPIASVTVPIERQTPFCEAMIRLSDELATTAPEDSRARIVETYRAIATDVPAEISAEFTAVLEALEAGDRATPTSTTSPDAVPATSASVTDSSVATEGDPFFDEGYLPGDSPVERLNAYVVFACQDSSNNPGPPPTEPLDDRGVETTTG